MFFRPLLPVRQHGVPISEHWGDGTLTSSDGQRFAVRGEPTNARAIPRYFGFGKGITHYSWTSYAYAQFGTRVIPSTLRDATAVLDALLDLEPDGQIQPDEHAVDTAGQTLILFALFDLLGWTLAPRIQDISDQRIGAPSQSRPNALPNVDGLLSGPINHQLISERWDDMCRIAATIKKGHVTASLLVGKLHRYPRQNQLVSALMEYGKLIRSIYITRWYIEDHLRRRVGRQLNKGESANALRGHVCYANNGQIGHPNVEDPSSQPVCLILVVSAITAWNAVYMNAAVERLRTRRAGETVGGNPQSGQHPETTGKDDCVMACSETHSNRL